MVKPKRPGGAPQRAELSLRERQALAARARYEGSGEHKDKRWWGGLPMAKQLPGGRVGRPGKQQTTVCPLTTDEDRKQATEWVRQAIINGQYKFHEADQEFPKKIWHRANGRIWYGLCLNAGNGEYKGWPIEEQERREVFG